MLNACDCCICSFSLPAFAVSSLPCTALHCTTAASSHLIQLPARLCSHGRAALPSTDSCDCCNSPSPVCAVPGEQHPQAHIPGGVPPCEGLRRCQPHGPRPQLALQRPQGLQQQSPGVLGLRAALKERWWLQQRPTATSLQNERLHSGASEHT